MRVSATWTRTVIVDERERTGFGENTTSSITSLAGSAMLSIGIEIFPFGSRIWPAGPPGCATPVGADVAAREPPAFLAVTITRTDRFTSAAVTAYVRLVAPATLPQFPPFESQRCHWYVYAIGSVPAQTPGFAVRVSPSRSVPEIVGIAVFCGLLARRPIVPVFTDASAAPSELRAVTTTRRRLPRSLSPNLYVRVRTFRLVQLAIPALHRTHR